MYGNQAKIISYLQYVVFVAGGSRCICVRQHQDGCHMWYWERSPFHDFSYPTNWIYGIFKFIYISSACLYINLVYIPSVLNFSKLKREKEKRLDFDFDVISIVSCGVVDLAFCTVAITLELALVLTPWYFVL